MVMAKIKLYCLILVLAISNNKCTGSNVDYSDYDYDYDSVTLKTTAGPSTTTTVSTSTESTTRPPRRRPGDPARPDEPAKGSDLPDQDHPREDAFLEDRPFRPAEPSRPARPSPPARPSLPATRQHNIYIYNISGPQSHPGLLSDNPLGVPHSPDFEDFEEEKNDEVSANYDYQAGSIRDRQQQSGRICPPGCSYFGEISTCVRNVAFRNRDLRVALSNLYKTGRENEAKSYICDNNNLV